MDRCWKEREREREEKRQIGMDLVLQVFLRKIDPKERLLLRV